LALAFIVGSLVKQPIAGLFVRHISDG
jgi:hypothetical protein